MFQINKQTNPDTKRRETFCRYCLAWHDDDTPKLGAYLKEHIEQIILLGHACNAEVLDIMQNVIAEMRETLHGAEVLQNVKRKK